MFSMTPKGKLDEFAAHVRNVKALARGNGREIDVYTVAVVTCRANEREAEQYYRHWGHRQCRLGRGRSHHGDARRYPTDTSG